VHDRTEFAVETGVGPHLARKFWVLVEKPKRRELLFVQLVGRLSFELAQNGFNVVQIHKPRGKKG